VYIHKIFTISAKYLNVHNYSFSEFAEQTRTQ